MSWSQWSFEQRNKEIRIFRGSPWLQGKELTVEGSGGSEEAVKEARGEPAWWPAGIQKSRVGIGWCVIDRACFKRKVGWKYLWIWCGGWEESIVTPRIRAWGNGRLEPPVTERKWGTFWDGADEGQCGLRELTSGTDCKSHSYLCFNPLVLECSGASPTQ